MQSLTFSPNLIFTRLHARIIQEEGSFTVSVLGAILTLFGFVSSAKSGVALGERIKKRAEPIAMPLVSSSCQKNP